MLPIQEQDGDQTRTKQKISEKIHDQVSFKEEREAVLRQRRKAAAATLRQGKKKKQSSKRKDDNDVVIIKLKDVDSVVSSITTDDFAVKEAHNAIEFKSEQQDECCETTTNSDRHHHAQAPIGKNATLPKHQQQQQ